MSYEQAVKDLQDNLIVIVEIERRQSITDKLNGLIRYMDGMEPLRQPS